MKKPVALIVMCISSICCFAQSSQSQGQTNGDHWVSAWTTSLFLSTPLPGFAAESPITDKTIRVVTRPTIGGNRILHDVTGPSALSRFDRDVLSLPGATNMIVLLGINDIGFPRVRMPRAKAADAKEGPFASQAVSADEMIVGLQQIIARARAHGIKVFGATLTPFEGTNVYDESGEAIRQAVNKWIRSTDAFDAIIDFDKAICDPKHPARVRQEYDSGDHIHPRAAGYKAMADLIPLNLLRGKQKPK